MLERPECTGPFLPLFLRAPRTPLGHHNQLAQGPREHCLIYMTIIFGWLQVRCAREACAARGTRLHPLIHFRNGPFLGVAGWKFLFLFTCCCSSGGEVDVGGAQVPNESLVLNNATVTVGPDVEFKSSPIFSNSCQKKNPTEF